jgi:hypothetical protein
MKLRLADLEAAAKNRPAGYLEDCLSRGTVSDGRLELTTAEYLSLCAKYRLAGDAVEVVAKPIARLIDKVTGTKLTGCGGCARRREKLNSAFSKSTSGNS